MKKKKLVDVSSVFLVNRDIYLASLNAMQLYLRDLNALYDNISSSSKNRRNPALESLGAQIEVLTDIFYALNSSIVDGKNPSEKPNLN
jgi:hypothetical protein